MTQTQKQKLDNLITDLSAESKIDHALKELLLKIIVFIFGLF